MTQPIHNFVDPHLLARASRHDRMVRRLMAALPAPLHGHCWVAEARGQELRLLTDNPHLIPILRYRQTELLKLVNSDPESTLDPPVSRLRISISTPLPPTPIRGEPSLRPWNVPPEAVSALTAAAARTDSLQLRYALLRLATHQRVCSPREGN